MTLVKTTNQKDMKANKLAKWPTNKQLLKATYMYDEYKKEYWEQVNKLMSSIGISDRVDMRASYSNKLRVIMAERDPWWLWECNTIKISNARERKALEMLKDLFREAWDQYHLKLMPEDKILSIIMEWH
jgi:hypothetical protein